MDEVSQNRSCWGVTFWAVAAFAGAVMVAEVVGSSAPVLAVQPAPPVSVADATD